jgi:hypothetical protein
MTFQFRRRNRVREVVVPALVAGAVLAGIVLSSGPSTAAPTSAGSPAAGSDAGAFSATKTITRDHLVNGKNDVVDRRTVSLHVNQTKNLQGRQEINVSWTGAHPTGGIVADQNSIDAQQEEYPFVLLECRGVDSTSVRPADQVSPQTCWTQDWSERYQDSYQTDFPPYRLDRYATEADRAQVADAPNRLPTGCFPAPTQHWVPFVAANGHVYQGGPAGCAGQPPESQSVGGSALPSNETFGVTGLDGRGSAKFDVWTTAENASLGCSQTVACSLVAVPIVGISCDVAATGLPAADQPPSDEIAAATAGCEATGAFAPGQIVTPQGGDNLAVSGSLWWSASNWRNRISVPLGFAVPADACDVVTGAHDVDIYGSELLIQATGQWAPHFCLNRKLFKFSHVQTGEPEARNLVATGGAEAAFTSDAPTDGYGKPVVSAPVAVSGFAITYVIDAANGQPYTKLRLTPLLLAKLLTESYPAELAVQQEDSALSNNPLNISLDPEFIKLNPGITEGVDATDSAATLLALSSDSDVMAALTSYINADPTARAWLNGKPDPWGMVVNPAYKGIKLPVDQWPLLSKFEPKQYYQKDLNDCLFHSPVPYLPLVAAPLASLENISEAMQFAIAQSTTACSQIDGTTLGEKLVPLGRQTVGFRFMIGVTSLADARRYEVNTAALQTTANHFVAPDDASLRAAAGFLKPDTKTGTWPIPYATLRTSAKASAAYPGIMVVYAAIPTSGLPAADAADYATLVRYIAGAGQDPGLGVGQLPPGYLPLTTGNGLGTLDAYSLSAAAAVAAQKGALPPLIAVPHHRTGGSTGPSTDPTSDVPPPVIVPPPVTNPSSTAPSTSADTSPSATPSSLVPAADQTPPASHPMAFGATPAVALGAGCVGLVLALVIAGLSWVGAPATLLLRRRRRR